MRASFIIYVIRLRATASTTVFVLVVSTIPLPGWPANLAAPGLSAQSPRAGVADDDDHQEAVISVRSGVLGALLRG